MGKGYFWRENPIFANKGLKNAGNLLVVVRVTKIPYGIPCFAGQTKWNVVVGNCFQSIFFQQQMRWWALKSIDYYSRVKKKKQSNVLDDWFTQFLFLLFLHTVWKSLKKSHFIMLWSKVKFHFPKGTTKTQIVPNDIERYTGF